MIPGMAESGGGETAGQARPSRLRDYVDPPPTAPDVLPPTPESPLTEPDLPPAAPQPPPPAPVLGPAPAPASRAASGPVSGAASATEPAEATELPAPQPENDPEPPDATRRRREFAAVLGEFRRTPVLLPLVEDDAPLVADFGGIRWIYAFSHEEALARFAIARGEAGREWPYRRVLGARLLDVGTVVAGAPCGVALDVGSEGEGVLFPPVEGIVPDEAAVDTDGEGRR